LLHLDPWVPGAALDLAQRTALMEHALRLMQQNLAPGPGTRITRNALGGPRKWVYGRSGEGCLVCGTIIGMRRQGAAGRSTYFCPRCQNVAL
jgi:endonuclease-8